MELLIQKHNIIKHTFEHIQKKHNIGWCGFMFHINMVVRWEKCSYNMDMTIWTQSKDENGEQHQSDTAQGMTSSVTQPSLQPLKSPLYKV